jgi:ABC-type proline/glycine betaine transport system ATPase subunit
MKKKVIKLTESELVKMIQRIVKEDSGMSMMSDDADPIIIMRINREDLTSKKMSFYEYEAEDGYLTLFSDEHDIAIMYDGQFRDADHPERYIYKPMNKYAREVFSEII